jgi:hypothetical protein
MLRITVHAGPGTLTFQVEGGLVGPWVREAETCWRQAQAGAPHAALRFDLGGVTMIDAAGKELLAAAHAAGARLAASGCLMRAVVAQITHTQLPECGSH